MCRVCDRDLARAGALAAACGVPKSYDDVSAMIRAERPDFLDVIAEPRGHGPVVRLAAEAGIPAICQKPIAPTLAECEDLVSALPRGGGTVRRSTRTGDGRRLCAA